MKPIKLFTKDYCEYCVWAKEALDNAGYEYTFEEIQDRPDIHEQLKAMTGQQTVPYVFVGDEMIGGCEDMIALMRSGKFEKLVED